MTRVWIGLAMAWAMSVSPVAASSTAPQLSISRNGQGATIILRADALTVSETLTRSAMDVRIAQGDDVLRFSGDLEGRVSIERNGHRRELSMRSPSAVDRAALNTMFDNSSALAAFDDLLQTSWARTTPEAKLFVSTRELIRVLQGEGSTTVARMAKAPVASALGLTFVRQRLSPSECWDSYARDVTKFTYDLQSCISQLTGNWWNPLHLAWCSYEYNLKSSLSAIWLLDCYGVPV